MLPSNTVCGYTCGFSNYFLNFKAIIVLFSSISYDKMFYTLAGSQISTIMTSFRLQHGITRKYYISEESFHLNK